MAKNLPLFDWSSSNLTEAFKLFRQQCELMFDVKDVQKQKQVSHILLLAGQEGLKRYNSWGLTGEDATDPDVLWKKFEEQLDPVENFRIARLWLQKYRQKADDSIDDFVNRCKLQAQKCDFANAEETNDRIIDQLIYGVRYPDLQKDYLAKDKDMTLEQAITLGRSFEASMSHMQRLSAVHDDGATAAVHAFNGDSRSQECRQCGRQHPPKKCPAYGSTCGACGKKNHWAKLCRGKNRNKQRNSSSRGRSRPRSQERKFNRRNHSNSRYSRSRSSSQVHSVHQQPQHANQPEDLNDQFEQLSFSGIHIDVENIEPEANIDTTNRRDEVFTDIHVQLPDREKVTATLTVKVDTGAQGNTLPLRVFRRMCPKLLNPSGYPKPDAVRSSTTRLTAYNNTSIRHYGLIRLRCSHSGKSSVADFYIVECGGPAILGLLSSLDMNLVSVHCAITAKPSGANVEYSLPSIPSTDDLVTSYPNLFDKIGNFPGEYHITVDPNIPPVVHAPRKTPIQLKDEIQSQLDSMIQQGVIRPVTEPTEWVSSLTYSRKADGSLRICLDPKDLNRAILRCHYKVPTLEEITHRFCGARVFSKLDAKNGYWSIKLDAESQLLTAFHTPFGRHCFCRCPFGLVMSQDVFQSRMDNILEKVGNGVLGIADDVAVFAPDQATHDAVLHKLMRVASEEGLTFNSKKCQINVTSIKFYGMIYDADGAHPDPDKLADIQALPTPEDKTSLLEFLGLATYMSPFIPKLADQTANLRMLLKKDVPFVWSPTYQATFDKIKQSICQATTLAYYDPTKETVLQVDASMKGLGAVLIQDDRPIMFASKSLSDTEQRYANIERELLAAVFAVERFHTFIYGSTFMIESDHKPLEMISLKNLGSAPPRLQRMLLRLQGYDFTIKYRPGREMLLADCLSRQPNTGKRETIGLDVKVCLVQFSSSKLHQLQEATNKDDILCALRDVILSGWPDDRRKIPVPIRTFWSFRDELSVENGLIMKGERVVIPQSMQAEILTQLHFGHQGTTKCQLRAKTCVYWVNINQDIEKLVAQCPACQVHQPSQPSETLQPHEIPTRPWQTLGTDLFHFDSHEYLVLADYYTKFPVVRRIHGPCTTSAIVATVKQILSEYGRPDRIRSDNGPQFGSAEFLRFLQCWKIDHVTSSPRYPKSNGFIENTVKTVKAILSKAKMCKSDPDLALLCARTTPIDSQLPSPAELMFSRKIVANLPVKAVPSYHIAYDRDKVQQRLQERQDNQKKYHDRSGAKDLPPLMSGQTVTVQDQQSGLWSPATVLDKCPEPRSYIIETARGSIMRRNRQHLRGVPPRDKHVHFEDTPSVPENVPIAANPQPASASKQPVSAPTLTPDASLTQDAPRQNANEQYRTRSGRAIKKPKHFDAS